MKVKDVFDAIEKNGLPKAKGYFLKDAAGVEFDTRLPLEPTSGCALGQAAFNLGRSPRYICAVLNSRSNEITTYIVNQNDNTNKTLPQIAASAREVFSDLLEEELI